MVRITLYDPKVSAEVYSRRRAAELPLESPVAEGLGRLGRSISQREERREAGHQDKTRAMRVLGKMRRTEFARLNEEARAAGPESRWAARGYVLEYLNRRDQAIADLARTSPRAAHIVAENSAALTEDVSRRAIVVESAGTGDALAADITAAVGDAVETARSDPTQGQAVLSEIRATLTGLAEEGMDSDAIAAIIGEAERKVMNAAFGQRLSEDPEAVREDLATGQFGDGLSAEEVESLTAKADREVEVRRRRAEAVARSAEDAFLAEFRGHERRLLDGGASDHETFGNDAIRARVPPDLAERLILERDRAAARGRAFAEIEFMSEAQIEGRLESAGREEIRHLLWARGHRRRLMRHGAAAFALRNPHVRQAHERWLQARADGDAAAAAQAGLVYADAARALQRRLGIAEPDRSVLTTDISAELVRKTELPDGLDANALGTMLRDQFGEHWRVALADLERAGLSEQIAIIAALDGPGRQPASRQLAALVGTRTSDLRESAGDAAAAIDGLLGITIGGVRGTSGDHAIGADTSRGELVRRRAYALAAEGLAPTRAVRIAIEELSVPNTSATAGLEGLSLEVLAESQGIRPTALGGGGAQVESILRRLARFQDLSGEEQATLKEDITRLRGSHEGYAALRDRYGALENSAGFHMAESDGEAVEHATVAALDLHYRQFIGRNLDDDPIAKSIAFTRIGSALFESERTGEENREWINTALTGDDSRRRNFAADYLAHVGRLTGVDIGDVLSESGLETYLALAHLRYEKRDHPDAGRRRSSDARLEALAEFATVEGDWGVRTRLASRLLVDINRSIDGTDDQREALVEYISRVVTPFNRIVGQRLQQAVIALRTGSENIGEFPGRFAFLLSDDRLVEAAVARGMDRLNFNSEPLRPDGLDWLDHAMGGGGVVLSAGAALTPVGWVSLSAGLLGLAGSTAGYRQAIDDANDELNAYLINMELYYRFQGLMTNPRTSAVENKIRDPDDTPDIDLNSGRVVPGDPATEVMNKRRR